MTEADWNRFFDVREAIVFLEDTSLFGDRKARLLASACARTLWHYLGDERSKRAIEIAEKFADGHCDLAGLKAASEAAIEAVKGEASRAAAWAADRHGSWQAARMAAMCAVEGATTAVGSTGIERQRQQIRRILHDIFGNPFHPVKGAPTCERSVVVDLARGIYTDRAVDRLPILADALEDAGCTDAAILEHCRDPGPHVRGCWVVDLILGKS
jgi:hypothetical protein